MPGAGGPRASTPRCCASSARGCWRSGAEARLLRRRCWRCCARRGWSRRAGRQRTDSTHVLAAVRPLNRLELVGEALRHALDAWRRRARLARGARRAPARRFPDRRLPGAQAAASCSPSAWAEEAPGLGCARPGCSTTTRAPRRAGARRRTCPRRRRSPPRPTTRTRATAASAATRWAGYRAHLTEACDPDAPHPITDVATAPAADPDRTASPARGAAATWSARCWRTPAGRRAPGRATPRPPAPSTGRRSAPPAPRAGRAAPGSPPSPAGRQLASSSIHPAERLAVR